MCAVAKLGGGALAKRGGRAAVEERRWRCVGRWLCEGGSPAEGAKVAARGRRCSKKKNQKNWKENADLKIC
nr:hypothetical protein Iba_chr10aCG11110 [Ipomoea batatas]